MRVIALLAAMAAVVPSLAYIHGEIPIHVAVRSDGDGKMSHFYENDHIEFLKKKDDLAKVEARQHAKSKRQNDPTAPESDTYPVYSDGSGPKAFVPGGISKKRQDDPTAPESDTYPVHNDGSGPKAFTPGGNE